MPKVTLHASEETHQAVLPQRPALEPVPVDNPGVGTKRGTGAGLPATGVQHGRGETEQAHLPVRRHLPKADGPAEAENGGLVAPTCAATKPVAARVFVLDRHGNPVMPCHPARARKLLADGRAVVAHHTPFVIRLKGTEVGGVEAEGVEVGMTPGSEHTGVAVFRTGQDGTRHGLVAVQVDHRAKLISKKLTTRASLRRGRRSRKLRYREPRFFNRHPAKCCSCGANAAHGRDRCRPCQTAGGQRQDDMRPARLAPSLAHLVGADVHMVAKLCRWAPVSAVHLVLARFDTQALQDPEISGTEYQQGALAGYEVREYLLEKWGHRCAYCDAPGFGRGGVVLNIDHVRPRSKGGSDRVSNLVVACIACNQEKDDRPLEGFLAHDPARLARVKAQLKAPLRDAAAVNSTRWALYGALRATGLPVSTSTGGRAKWARAQNRLAKSHTLDAVCAGEAKRVASVPAQVVLAKATGRGAYSRTRPDRYGFPRLRMPRTKLHHGFQTGDLVRSAVPSGRHAGVYVGRVVVRSSGTFSVRTRTGAVQSVNYKNCRLIQRSDGWGWQRKTERGCNAA